MIQKEEANKREEFLEKIIELSLAGKDTNDVRSALDKLNSKRRRAHNTEMMIKEQEDEDKEGNISKEVVKGRDDKEKIEILI